MNADRFTLDLFPDAAHARLTDPETSHAAAASIDRLTARRGAVLALLARFPGGLSDSELVEVYQAKGVIPPQSPSGIRTRRSELVDAGLVEYSGNNVTTPSGRSSRVWRVSKLGKELLG